MNCTLIDFKTDSFPTGLWLRLLMLDRQCLTHGFHGTWDIWVFFAFAAN